MRFEALAQTILEHRKISCDSNALDELFSVSLPHEVRRFAAGWLVRTVAISPEALAYKNTEAQAGLLFDRAYEGQVYRAIGIEEKTQTYEKVQKLTDHLQSLLDELDDWIRHQVDLNKPNELKDIQTNLLRLFNDNRSRPFLLSILPRPLVSEGRVKSLFSDIAEYAEDTEVDPIHRRNNALDACDTFENEAQAFGTRDSDRILGGIARQLKSAVNNHFATLESSKSPKVDFSRIEKKYPLGRATAAISFKIRIKNEGTGPARELSLDNVDHDD